MSGLELERTEKHATGLVERLYNVTQKEPNADGKRELHRTRLIFIDESRTGNPFKVAESLEQFCRLAASFHSMEEHTEELAELWRDCGKLYGLAGAKYQYQERRCRENAEIAETIRGPLDVPFARKLLDSVDSAIKSVGRVPSLAYAIENERRQLRRLERAIPNIYWAGLSEQDVQLWLSLLVETKVDSAALRFLQQSLSNIDSLADVNLVWGTRASLIKYHATDLNSLAGSVRAAGVSATFEQIMAPALDSLDKTLDEELSSANGLIQVRKTIFGILLQEKVDAIYRSQLKKRLGVNDTVIDSVLSSLGSKLRIDSQAYLVSKDGITLEDPMLRVTVTRFVDEIKQGKSLILTPREAFDLLADRRSGFLANAPTESIVSLLQELNKLGNDELEHYIPSEPEAVLSIGENLLRIVQAPSFSQSERKSADRILTSVIDRHPSILLEPGLDASTRFELAYRIGRIHGETAPEAVLDSLLAMRTRVSPTTDASKDSRLDVLTSFKGRIIALKLGVASHIRQFLEQPRSTYEVEEEESKKEEAMLPMLELESTLISYVKETTPLHGILGFLAMAAATFMAAVIVPIVLSKTTAAITTAATTTAFFLGLSALVMPLLAGLTSMGRWYWLSPEVHGQRILLGATSAFILINAAGRISPQCGPTSLLDCNAFALTLGLVSLGLLSIVMTNGIELIYRAAKHLLSGRKNPYDTIDQTRMLTSEWTGLYTATRGAVLVGSLLPISQSNSTEIIWPLIAIGVSASLIGLTAFLRRYLGDDVREEEHKLMNRFANDLRNKPVETYVRSLLIQRSQPLALDEVVEKLPEVDEGRVRKVFKRLEKKKFGKVVTGQFGRTILVKVD